MNDTDATSEPRLIKVEVDDDLFFLAEIDNDPPMPQPGGWHGSTNGDDGEGNSDWIGRTIRAASLYIKGAFDEFNHPDELSVEFSIALKGETGIPVIAKQSAESTFKVALKWINDPPVQNDNEAD